MIAVLAALGLGCSLAWGQGAEFPFRNGSAWVNDYGVNDPLSPFGPFPFAFRNDSAFLNDAVAVRRYSADTDTFGPPDYVASSVRFFVPTSGFGLENTGNCMYPAFAWQLSGSTPGSLGGPSPFSTPSTLYMGGSTNQFGFFSNSVLGSGTFVEGSLPLTFNLNNPIINGLQATGGAELTASTITIFLTYKSSGQTEQFTANATQTALPTAACTAPANAGDPVSTDTGEVHSKFAPALALGGGPLRLQFQLYYASLLNFNGINSTLGANWMHNFNVQLVLYNSGANATVVRFGGQTVRFQMSGGNWQLVTPSSYVDQLLQVNGEYRYFSVYDNLIYAFNSTGNLIRIQDRNGNQITVTPGPSGPTQAADGLGRALTFSYTSGSLTKVTDQSGRFVSFVQTSGNLTSFTDAAGKTTTYTYTSAPTGSVLVTTTLPLGNNIYTQAYDPLGRVVKQTDGLGNAVATLAYPAAGANTTTVTDALANKSSYGYSTPTLVSSYTDALGNSGTISYDSSSRPTVYTDRNGNKRTLTYQALSGLPASATDEDGNTTSFSYTASASGGFTAYDLTGVAYADGATESYSRDANGNLLKFTDAAGKTTTYTYNARGQALTVVNALNGTTTYTYSADGTMASLQTPAGDTTTFAYDNLKRLNQVTHPDATTFNLAYDALSRVVQVTDERSKVTKASYDDNGQLIAATDALSNVTSYTYDAAENLTAVKTPVGTATDSYDADDLVGTITAPTGETRTFGYDADLRATTTTDAAGPVAAVSYDNESGLTSLTDGAGRKLTSTPDPLGLLTMIKSPLGETWQQTFDKRNRLSTTKDPLGRTSAYSYDPRGFVSGAALPGPVTASYIHDGLGGITSVTDPNGNNWARAYDSQGRRISETDPLGNKVTYTYDSRDRVVSESSSVASVQVTYDAAGNPTQRLYSDATNLAFTYDDDNRRTGGTGVALSLDALGSIVNSNGLAITRDASERIVSVGYPAGKVTYTYNNRGLLSQVSDWKGGTVSFTYDASLQLATITRSNGVTTTYTYDADGRLSGVMHAGASTLASVTLQRDADGRITGETRTQPQAASMVGGMTSFAYDAADQLSGATYDALGRLVRDSLRTYSFDAASRLTSYQGVDGAASFTYDAFGMRTSRTSAGIAESYTIDYATALPTVAVARSGGIDQRYYVWTPDGTLLYWIDASTGAHHFYAFDELGNTVLLTGDNGAITDSYGIPVYGENPVQNGSTSNPFTFQGAYGVMQEGSTTLYCMRARYFDSNPGRFLSRDPVHSPAPKAIGPYQYAMGDPVGHRDPTGLSPVSTAPPPVTPSSPLYGSGKSPKVPGIVAVKKACGLDPCFGFGNSCSGYCTNKGDTCQPQNSVDFEIFDVHIQLFINSCICN